MRIVGIAGSIREGSFNRALLRAAVELAPKGMEIIAWEWLADVPHYNAELDTDERRPETVVDLKRTIAEADGVLVVTPEYNYSVPGVLKNAIDWASRPGHKSVLAGKPVGIIGASNGLMGTARAQAHLREVLYSALARVMPHPGVAVSQASQKFAEGKLTDEPTRTFVAAYLRQLADYVRQQNAPPP